MMDGYGGFGAGGEIAMLLFWVLIVVGIVVAVRYATSNGHREQSESPLDILKARYARGEIDQAQFNQLKKDLL